MATKTRFDVTLPSGKVVRLREPTVRDQILAARMSDEGDTALIAQVITHIDGVGVDYNNLRTWPFSLKDTAVLSQVYLELFMPTPEEVAAAKGSVRVVEE